MRARSGPLLSRRRVIVQWRPRRRRTAASRGIVLIATASSIRRSAARRWGALTGACIAAYTLNDGWAVRILGISPFLIDFSGNVFRVLALSKLALGDRPELAREWHAYRRPVMVVATLGPLGYLLVLFAMRRAPISHVAPARELATLVGTWFGARLLGEQAAAQRLAGALCIVAGVVVALSG